MAMPQRVRVVEVGPRDGLQNEETPVPAETKVMLIDRLSAAGLPSIEAGSFVSPKWIPQMAGSDKVMAAIRRNPGTTYGALTPNMKGFEGALAARADEVGVFTAASESFSQKNTNCSIAETLERFKPVVAAAKAHGIGVRGALSTALGCPYEGAVPVAKVVDIATRLIDLGCDQISIADTIGVGTPGAVKRVIEAVAAKVPLERLAVHFHDTYGQALANILAALEVGVATVDASVAGLGGCPYAKGASGNVATEEVLYMLHGLGIETGVDLDQVVDIAWFIASTLGREPGSKVSRAIAAKRRAA
jgi:hydroxymethylglutaryl-CoA lyase